MAVLCRAAGVPARYVEGFAPADQKIEDLYYVAAKDAHAWTEVYLDMFGWVQFEPTAPLSAAFASSYFMGGGQNAPSDLSSEAAMQAFLDRAEQERQMREAMMRFNDTDAQPLTPAEDGAAGVVNLWWLLALLPLVPAVHTLRRRFYTWRLPKMRMTRVRAEWLYRRYLRLFRRVGLGRKRYETASEYGTRLDSLGWYYSVSMREVGGVFNAARFGRTPPDERGRVALLTMWDAREGIVRRKLGRGAAFAYKYVLGWI
jgi:hypothetical protein